MSKDGPATASITERLKAKQAEDLREQEAVMQIELTRLVGNLRQSSDDALRQTGESIKAQISEIEAGVDASRNRILMGLAEIEVHPKRTMRITMIVSAVTGGIVAMIPWAVMTGLGMGATETVTQYLDRQSAIRAEEARISTLQGIKTRMIDGQQVLMLPEGTTQIYICGATRTPCIRIEE